MPPKREVKNDPRDHAARIIQAWWMNTMTVTRERLPCFMCDINDPCSKYCRGNMTLVVPVTRREYWRK